MSGDDDGDEKKDGENAFWVSTEFPACMKLHLICDFGVCFVAQQVTVVEVFGSIRREMDAFVVQVMLDSHGEFALVVAAVVLDDLTDWFQMERTNVPRDHQDEKHLQQNTAVDS